MMDESEITQELASIKAELYKLINRVDSAEKQLNSKTSDQPLAKEKKISREIPKEKVITIASLESGSFSVPDLIENFKKSGGKLPQISIINILGAISLFIAGAYFFKIAVDQGLIGPIGRVILGYTFGLVSMILGEVCQRKDYKAASIGFIGLGQSFWFLTTWFSNHNFHLIDNVTAFITYFAVTALVVVQSLRYNSQAIASLGFAGAFLAPLLSGPKGGFIFGGIYYLILTSGVLYIAYQKNWNVPKWGSFIFSFLFLFIWHIKNSAFGITLGINEKIAFLITLGLFFVLYSGIAISRSIKLKTGLGVFDLCLASLNGLFSVLLAYNALPKDTHVYLGIIAALVSVVYAFLSNYQVSRGVNDKKVLNVFLSIAVVFLTIAVRLIVPIPYVTIAWALEAIILAYLSNKKEFEFLEFNYLVILVIIAFRLFFIDNLLSIPISTKDKYSPLSLPTISGLLSIFSFFYCLKRLEANNSQEKTNTLTHKNYGFISGILWIMVLFGSFFTFWREFYGLAFIMNGSFRAVGILHNAFLLLFSSGLIAAFTLTQLKESNKTKSNVILLFAAIPLIISLSIFQFNELNIFPLHIHFLSLSVIGFIVVLGLLASKLNESLKYLTKIVFLIGLFLSMGVIRRELYLITGGHLHSGSYEVAMSVCFSILALAIYTWGLLKADKFKLIVSYLLFAFIGLKVYFSDLAFLSQIYRALSLMGFGLILMFASFIENRILKSRIQKGDSTQ
jgi:uncharacterized membrane protein